MNDLGRSEQQQPVPRRALSEGEKRTHLEKRIKELRRKKKRERRQNTRHARTLILILLVLFFSLFFLSSVYLLASSGEGERYLSSELPASNLESFGDLMLEEGSVSEPAITATSAFLMDPHTADILYEKNADQPLPMASTTKIMTAVVVLENASLNQSTCISANASAVGESSVWLEEGEYLTVEQLLYALMVQSANDAAVALAECVGGNEDAFVDMMNEKVSELDLEHTHFANPHGLDEEGHYSSARDLAIMAAYAMEIPQFRSMVITDGYEIPWPGNQYPRVLENHNKFLDMYPYATGIKTGYTLGAGKCLVASAQKDQKELISVILDGGESYWDQTISLMEYGFNDFAHVEYAYSGQPLASVEVGDFPRREVAAVGSEDLVFTVRRDMLADYETASIHHLEWVSYPVEAGQEVGYMEVAEGTDHELREPLVSDAYRRTPSLIIRVLSFIAAVFALWWKGILWLIPGL